MTSRWLRPWGLLPYLFGWLLFCAFPAIAADILQIETETTVEVSADRLKTRVAFTNKGTASAYNLQVHLSVLGREASSPVVAQLDPGQSERTAFDIDVSGIQKGRYPMTVRVDFHDANQYPFSALSGMTFHMGEAVNPDLAAVTRDMTLNKKGTLQLDVKNLGNNSEEVAATLVLPREFSSPQARKTFQIAQRSEQTVEFEVRNFSALPGASYPVFCYLEYDADDTHHTAVARSLVTVAADENLFRRFRWAWITLAAVLAVLFIAVLIREQRKKSRERHENHLSR